MGTRSTVKFYDEDSIDPILSVYQQFGGYIDGVGHDLANWLISKKMINGISSGQTMENGYANGVWCLVAQYVAQHKTEVGSFYLTTPKDTQEYNYEVRVTGVKSIAEVGGKFSIKVTDDDGKVLFEGSPNELLNLKQDEE